MKLAVIGSGNIGKSIGAWASRAGYEVIFSSKNLEHAKDAARILEPLGLLNISPGYSLGHGTLIGFSFLR